MTRPVGVAVADPWIVPLSRGDHAVRLLCLPHAGGGASSFRPWVGALPGVGVVGVLPPGRERRIAEPPIAAIEPLVAELLPRALPWLGGRYALFGHSMGALVAFELARALRRSGHPAPEHLYVSACPAPDVPQGERTSGLSDAEFLDRLRALRGTPDELFAMPELLELLLPALRADFAIVDRYEYRAEPPLACDLTAFCAPDDLLAPPATVAGWARHTSAAFSLHELPGGHFLVTASADALLARIRAGLTPSAVHAPPTSF
jgi:surfactin synthase thioesterase subunit